MIITPIRATLTATAYAQVITVLNTQGKDAFVYQEVAPNEFGRTTITLEHTFESEVHAVRWFERKHNLPPFERDLEWRKPDPTFDAILDEQFPPLDPPYY